METVEMDLMQAQIGSLATDVSRLEAKVAANNNILVEISNLRFHVDSYYGDASILAGEITEYIKKGKSVKLIIDTTQLGGNQIFAAEFDKVDIINGAGYNAYAIYQIFGADAEISGTYIIIIYNRPRDVGDGSTATGQLTFIPAAE